MAKPSVLRLLPLGVFVLVALVLGQALYSKEPVKRSRLIGKPFPEMNLPVLGAEGERLSRDAFKGKTVLVNVFASWCTVCVMEHDFISRIEGAYGIRVYGIAWRDEPVDTNVWLNKYGNPYQAVVMDQDGQFGIQLGVTGTPESFLIGPDGTILQHYPGALDVSVFESDFAPLIRKAKL